jgi:hypothetical protein
MTQLAMWEAWHRDEAYTRDKMLLNGAAFALRATARHGRFWVVGVLGRYGFDWSSPSAARLY